MVAARSKSDSGPDPMRAPWPSLFSCPQVSVHVSPVEGLCLAGGGLLAQQVSVPAGSARPVAFSVVPTAAASMPLKVVARGSFDIGDAVSKILQIEVSECWAI